MVEGLVVAAVVVVLLLLLLLLLLHACTSPTGSPILHMMRSVQDGVRCFFDVSYMHTSVSHVTRACMCLVMQSNVYTCVYVCVCVRACVHFITRVHVYTLHHTCARTHARSIHVAVPVELERGIEANARLAEAVERRARVALRQGEG